MPSKAQMRAASLSDAYSHLAQALGTDASFRWTVREDRNSAVVSFEAQERGISSLRTKVTRFVHVIEDMANKNGLTLTTNREEGDGSITLILDVISDADLAKLAETGKLDYYCQEIQSFIEDELTTRRTKDHEFKYPELPRGHELNRRTPRLDKLFSARADPELVAEVDRKIQELGVTKKAAAEEALRDWLDKHHE